MLEARDFPPYCPFLTLLDTVKGSVKYREKGLLAEQKGVPSVPAQSFGTYEVSTALYKDLCSQVFLLCFSSSSPPVPLQFFPVIESKPSQKDCCSILQTDN